MQEPHTSSLSKLNGIADCVNQTLFEKVCVLLCMAHLPQNMWGEALHHAMWLKNQMSMHALGGMMPWL